MPSMNTEYNKAYYEKNKDHIKELLYERILCPECKIYTAKGNMNKHLKTKKHIKNLEKSKEKKYKIIVVKDFSDFINTLKDREKFSNIQAIIFKKENWTENKAEKWLKMHNFNPIKNVHITENYLRYRLKNPNKLNEYRTYDIGNGVKLILEF